MAADTVTDEQSWALLRRGEDAWRVRDARSLASVLHPDNRIVFNFGEPVRVIDDAVAWIEERLKTQLDYVLTKEMRGIYNGNTVVSRWTGTWHDAAGQDFRGVGIELLTVNDDGLITNWEAVLHKEPV
jgi:nuclear transport factor 2 (NTF2) superfamily protein